ncbi:hypothetical protein FZEAL_4762 [Fusarium zealandicum]|uniref:Uncharacterized protein n=1 Tax=Fusarium zealandicum TaxID=1053134 RepID=A0A8H4ULT8_9HYPO|nr:hypothetical protein FZEAL_4762 [Fusarium zealandicum]
MPCGPSTLGVVRNRKRKEPDRLRNSRSSFWNRPVPGQRCPTRLGISPRASLYMMLYMCVYRGQRPYAHHVGGNVDDDPVRSLLILLPTGSFAPEIAADQGSYEGLLAERSKIDAVPKLFALR